MDTNLQGWNLFSVPASQAYVAKLYIHMLKDVHLWDEGKSSVLPAIHHYVV